MLITVGRESDPARRIRQHQGRRLRELRQLRQMTLRSLAARMSEQPGVTVTAAAISEWERGVSTPRQHMQVAVARALDVPWSTLFGLDGEVAS